MWEKVFATLPETAGAGAKAQKVLEINVNHPIYTYLKDLFEKDKEKIKEVAEVLYQGALMIAGFPVTAPTQFIDLVCELIAK